MTREEANRIKRLATEAGTVGGFVNTIERLVDTLVDDEGIVHQWPPAGMIIEAYSDDAWCLARSNGEGTADQTISSVLTRRHLLNMIKWRYLPAPDVWPREARCWVAAESGAYFFSIADFNIGQNIALHGRILHVEHRPEGK